MNLLLRFGVILAGIAAVFALLYLNKYVAKHYWLAETEDLSEAELREEEAGVQDGSDQELEERDLAERESGKD